MHLWQHRVTNCDPGLHGPERCSHCIIVRHHPGLSRCSLPSRDFPLISPNITIVFHLANDNYNIMIFIYTCSQKAAKQNKAVWM